jgi:uncharacterized membrane protein
VEYTSGRLPEALLGGEVNVGRTERIASVLGGAGLVALAFRNKGLGGALLGLVGGVLVHRGATGHCNVYGALGVDTTGRGQRGRLAAEGEVGVSAMATLTINRTPDDLYAFWRDFRNAPRYMDRVQAVEVRDEERSRWTAAGPLGRRWTWDSEVTEDRPGELIAWESLPGSDLPNRGWVQFLAVEGGARTEVRYFVEMDPPGGVVGEAIARAFHELSDEMLKGDLRRLRSLMEAGEIATTQGQPSGREEWVDDAGDE